MEATPPAQTGAAAQAAAQADAARRLAEAKEAAEQKKVRTFPEYQVPPSPAAPSSSTPTQQQDRQQHSPPPPPRSLTIPTQLESEGVEASQEDEVTWRHADQVPPPNPTAQPDHPTRPPPNPTTQSDDRPPARLPSPPPIQVTFVQYVPAHLKIGVPHPDPVVENASLSAVRPPEITYELRLAREVIEKGYLSDLQLESLVYAAQQHEKFDGENRKGFFIGDGAGIGKGRQLAGTFDRSAGCCSAALLLCTHPHPARTPGVTPGSVGRRDNNGERAPRPAQAHLGIGFERPQA